MICNRWSLVYSNEIYNKYKNGHMQILYLKIRKAGHMDQKVRYFQVWSNEEGNDPKGTNLRGLRAVE